MKRRERVVATPSMTAAPGRKAAGRKPSGGLAALEDVYVEDRAAWRRWLRAHHATSPGIWLVYDRKTSRPDRLSYADAVEEALCFGWIDSTVRPVDAAHYKQLFTRRKPKSVWSKLNKSRVERLIAEKRMRAPGLAAIETAQANGSWHALDAIDALTIPQDLRAALDANPAARANFDAFTPSARKAFLYWLDGAKRAETRATRVSEIIRRSAANEKSRLQPPASRP